MPPYHTMDENRTEYKDPDDVWIPTARWTDLIAPERGFYQLFTRVIRAMAMCLSCIMCWSILAMVWTISDARMRTIALRKQMQHTYNIGEGVKNSNASCGMRYANACNPSIRNVCCRKMCCCSQTLHWIQIFDTLMQLHGRDTSHLKDLKHIMEQ